MPFDVTNMTYKEYVERYLQEFLKILICKCIRQNEQNSKPLLFFNFIPTALLPIRHNSILMERYLEVISQQISPGGPGGSVGASGSGVGVGGSLPLSGTGFAMPGFVGAEGGAGPNTTGRAGGGSGVFFAGRGGGDVMRGRGRGGASRSRF